MADHPNYQLRPSKYVERKIFVEALQHLRNAGYKISNYRYLGFGSYYYVDFILFNQFLSIRKMTCLEKDRDIEKRMKFNKPFKFIKLCMKDILNYLPEIKNDEKYIIWLDYEAPLNKEILHCIGSLVGILMDESVLIVTVNATPGVPPCELCVEASKRIETLKSGFRKDLYPFCGEIAGPDITGVGLPRMFARTIRARINEALKGRPSDDFFQIFNYVYKDGQRMFTFGGVIDRKDNKAKILKALDGLKYLNFNEEPKKISIPSLTVREKLFLDQKLGKKKIVGKLPFELSKEEKNSYVEYARHCPTFREISVN
jgi:hypothetical protein